MRAYRPRSHLQHDPVVRPQTDPEQVRVEAGEGHEADRDPANQPYEYPPRYPRPDQGAVGVSLLALVAKYQHHQPQRGHEEVEDGSEHAEQVKMPVVAGADAGVQPVCS